jgi:hypothetical protein
MPETKIRTRSSAAVLFVAGNIGHRNGMGELYREAGQRQPAMTRRGTGRRAKCTSAEGRRGGGEEGGAGAGGDGGHGAGSE